MKWNPSQDEVRRMLRDAGLLPPVPQLRVVRPRPTKVARARIFIAQVLEMFAALVRPQVRT